MKAKSALKGMNADFLAVELDQMPEGSALRAELAKVTNLQHCGRSRRAFNHEGRMEILRRSQKKDLILTDKDSFCFHFAAGVRV